MSTVSKAKICNLALAHAGITETTIANLDTDTGTPADNCRIHYDVCRQFVLSNHIWNFATKRKVLADIGSPPTGWLYRYNYPSDCLRFREIGRQTRQEKPIPFQIEDDGTDEGLSIICDTYQAVGVYTRDVTNVGLFSTGFVAMFAWYLGSELAVSMSGDFKRQEACLKVYRSMYAAAIAQDSNEQQPDDELESPWEQARQNGGTV